MLLAEVLKLGHFLTCRYTKDQGQASFGKTKNQIQISMECLLNMLGCSFPKSSLSLSLLFFPPSHLHKKKLKYPGRSENILKRDIPNLPFGYQIIEIIALKEWEFP